MSNNGATPEVPPQDPSQGEPTTAASTQGLKRPNDSGADGMLHNPAKKSKGPLDATGAAAWEALIGQVKGHLRAMTSDECFSRALEMQMLARSEVGRRSQHLSNAMDLMTQPGAQVPTRIVKPSRASTGNMSAVAHAQLSPGQRVTKAEREVSKQKPIKTSMVAPVPCMKMTPPLPPRCEVDNAVHVELPSFCQLVNFPTARYYNNCVMCDESEFAIPKQNKGVCNNCDVAIWVVNPSGMNIKWCKGCKNFRKWIDFGVKVCYLLSCCFRLLLPSFADNIISLISYEYPYLIQLGILFQVPTLPRPAGS